jgi:hypothetical protein
MSKEQIVSLDFSRKAVDETPQAVKVNEKATTARANSPAHRSYGILANTISPRRHQGHEGWNHFDF